MCDDASIIWTDRIDDAWIDLPPSRIGDVPPGLGTPAQYILFAAGDQPALRVDAYRSPGEAFAFQDALVWHGFLVIGWGEHAYLLDVKSRSIVKHPLGSSFGHLYADERYLLIASAERLRRLETNGSQSWTSEMLGIDGVVVERVSDVSSTAAASGIRRAVGNRSAFDWRRANSSFEFRQTTFCCGIRSALSKQRCC